MAMDIFKFRYLTLPLICILIWRTFIPGPGFCSSNDAGSEQGRIIPPEKLETILAEVENNLGRVGTLKTKLLQEKNIALFSEPVFSKGILLFKSPDNIRFEFFEPFASVLLVSGGTVSKFEKFDGNWSRMDAGSRKMMGIILDHITAWVQGKFNHDNLYRVSGRDRAGGGYTIILEPRAEAFRSFINAFELGVTPAMDRLDQITIRESGEDYTTIRFSDAQINAPVAPVYFAGDEQPAAAAPQW